MKSAIISCICAESPASGLTRAIQSIGPLMESAHRLVLTEDEVAVLREWLCEASETRAKVALHGEPVPRFDACRRARCTTPCFQRPGSTNSASSSASPSGRGSTAAKPRTTPSPPPPPPPPPPSDGFHRVQTVVTKSATHHYTT